MSRLPTWSCDNCKKEHRGDHSPKGSLKLPTFYRYSDGIEAVYTGGDFCSVGCLLAWLKEKLTAE